MGRALLQLKASARMQGAPSTWERLKYFLTSPSVWSVHGTCGPFVFRKMMLDIQRWALVFSQKQAEEKPYRFSPQKYLRATESTLSRLDLIRLKNQANYIVARNLPCFPGGLVTCNSNITKRLKPIKIRSLNYSDPHSLPSF